MSGILIAIAFAAAAFLILITFVQVLYLEALRLRPHERPALEFFKDHILAHMGVETERALLTFSLLKHSVLLFLGVVVAAASEGFRHKGELRPILEAFFSAWALMMGATYVLPHVLYRRSNGRWLAAVLPLLRVMAQAMRPVVAVFAFFQSLTELAQQPEAAVAQQTPEANIEALISAGAEEGLIEESDRELIESVVAFGDTRVREVMTPRPNIVAIEEDETLEALRQLVINEQYSRIPVYQGSIDRVVGFVHVRDMFEVEEAERSARHVRELVRPIPAVPETKPVNDLFKEMQDRRAHMAIVVDEYGNTAGLVTMEDLVEKVFGEIRDEHEPGVDVTQEPNGDYIVSGNFGVDRLEELLGFRPNGEVESTTVGGLIMEWLGRVPQAGESVEREGVRLEVLASNDLRVEKVRLSKTERQQAQSRAANERK